MADQEPGEQGATGATAGEAVKPFRVFQTQADFDKMAGTIRWEAERKARNAGADVAELEGLRTELEQRRQADLEAKGKYEEAKLAIEKAANARAEKEATARQKAESALHKAIVVDQLRALAEAKGAYSAEDVVLRLRDRIVLDESYQVAVRSTDGSGAVQDGLTMEQAVVDLLKANPHLAKAAGSGTSAGAKGGASLGGSFSGTPTQREAMQKVADAKAAVAAKPTDNRAVTELLMAEQQLRSVLTS